MIATLMLRHLTAIPTFSACFPPAIYELSEAISRSDASNDDLRMTIFPISTS